MFVELIEWLRCPRHHEESPLVATASRTESRHIMDGVLGCPLCHAEFVIRDGEALFDFGAPMVSIPVSVETAMRLAAFLDLVDARGFAILHGAWSAHAEEIRQLTGAPLLLVNPPAGIDVSGTGIVRVQGRLPVAGSTARAAALDDAGDATLVDSAIGSVRPKGRIVGRATMRVPPTITEVARDAELWIGEKNAAPEDPARRLVTLRRG